MTKKKEMTKKEVKSELIKAIQSSLNERWIPISKEETIEGMFIIVRKTLCAMCSFCVQLNSKKWGIYVFHCNFCLLKRCNFFVDFCFTKSYEKALKYALNIISKLQSINIDEEVERIWTLLELKGKEK